MESFTHEVRASREPAAVLPELIAGLTAPLGNYGYKIRAQTEGGVTFVRTYRRWWVWTLTVLTFPIGLLFLFLTDEAPIVVTLTPEGEGTLVTVRGDGDKNVRRAFEGMVL